MSRWETKSLVEGALLSALTIILSLISIYVPLLNTFATLLCPVPIVVLAVRHGWRLSSTSAVVSALIVTMIAGPVNGIVILFTVGLVGTVLGAAFRKGYSPAKTLIISAIAVLIAQIVLVGIYAIAFKINIIYDTLRLMSESSQQSGEMMKQFSGLFGKFSANSRMLEQFERQQQQMANAVGILWRIIPVGFFVLPAIIGSFLNFTISRLVLNRLGHRIPGLAPFKEWRMPEQVVWGFIAGIILLWWGEKSGYPWITTVGLNLNMLFTMAYAVQGAAVVWFLLDHYNAYKLIRIIIVIYMFVLMQYLSFLGLLDCIFDFRKKILNRRKKT